ncbi:MAG: metal ABC transporter ATP-binding protein [Desulfovibrio sp.]
MSEPAIQIENASFAYNGRAALTGVTLRVERGAFMAVIGPNGGGKTTLVKLMLGLLQPDAGTVRVLGERPPRASRRIGYVPQHTHARAGFPITVLDTALMGVDRARQGLFGHSRAARDKALEALERVNMRELSDRLFGELSGGQKQRVLIARALAADAELLILDEPTASIDPHGSFCFFDFLCKMGEARKLTTVAVSHDMSLLTTRISSVAAVNRGVIASSGPELSKEMLELLYGQHEHTCAMDDYIAQLSQRYGPGRSENPTRGERP